MTPEFTSAIASFTAYCLGVSEKPLPVLRYEVQSLDRLRECTRELHQAQSALRASGKVARLTSGKGYVALTHDGLTLRVQVAKQSKRTQVTSTSLSAYHSTDFSTQALRVARCIFYHSVLGEDITRAEIAHFLGIQEGRVAGRVNQLLKDYGKGGYFDITGEYRLVLTGNRLSKCPGASEKLNEAMRFEPAPEVGTKQFYLGFNLNQEYYDAAILELEKQSSVKTELF